MHRWIGASVRGRHLQGWRVSISRSAARSDQKTNSSPPANHITSTTCTPSITTASSCVCRKTRVSLTFGSMEVEVSFESVEGGTKVVLQQSGIEDKVFSHMNCRSCWLYFMTDLKSVLEHGIDLRDHDHPDRASSMEVGYPLN
ncbi:MAG: hypothetical protein CME05_08200 [Gemmatimonadaceae bacterium]|nr:hypothetical protein [Gemmatimonadaceae bacterium]